MRAEVSELATMPAKGNLDKIVQHGKARRCHRQEHAAALARRLRRTPGLSISTLLVEESLNLAYHGARAEKQGFHDHSWNGHLIRPPAKPTYFQQDITTGCF